MEYPSYGESQSKKIGTPQTFQFHKHASLPAQARSSTF
jgi:hypothetical protein